jgi:hypothetical protein
VAAPTLTGPAERLYDWLQPWTADDLENGYGWAWLAAAIGAQHADLEAVVRSTEDGTPGWVRLMNPASESDCPDFAVPWVAQFAGARLDVGLPISTQRARLHPDANKKATSDAMMAAVRPLLTGTQSIRVVERDPTPYRHTYITRTSETPDPAAVVAVLSDPKIKPVGHWYTHVVSDAPLIAEGTRTIDASAGTIDGATLANIT